MDRRDFIAKLDAEEQKALNEFDKVKALAAALPSEVLSASLRISNTGYRKTYRLSYKEQTRESVATLMEHLPPVPLVRVKGTFLSFVPEERLTDKDRAENTLTPVAPFTFEIEEGKGFRSIGAKWYAHVGGELVMVAADLPNDPARFIAAHIRHPRTEEIREYRWNLDLRMPSLYNPYQTHDYFRADRTTPGHKLVTWLDPNIKWEDAFREG